MPFFEGEPLRLREWAYGRPRGRGGLLWGTGLEPPQYTLWVDPECFAVNGENLPVHAKAELHPTPSGVSRVDVVLGRKQGSGQHVTPLLSSPQNCKAVAMDGPPVEHAEAICKQRSSSCVHLSEGVACGCSSGWHCG